MITIARQPHDDQQQATGRVLLLLLDTLATAAWSVADATDDPHEAALFSGLACDLSDLSQTTATRLQELAPR